MCPISKLFDICNFGYRSSGEMISAVLVIIKRLFSRDLVPEQHEPASHQIYTNTFHNSPVFQISHNLYLH